MTKTPYQFRMNGFVVVSSLYLPISIMLIEILAWPRFLYFVAFSFACLFYALATGWAHRVATIELTTASLGDSIAASP